MSLKIKSESSIIMNGNKKNITHWFEESAQVITNKSIEEKKEIIEESSDPITELREKVKLIPETVFEENLNSQQQEILRNLSGIHLINACAGSGKTRTIIYAILKLLKNNVNPTSILLMTFTNKAAKDMNNKLESLVGCDIIGMLRGTFHSIGKHFIWLYENLLTIRTPTILDESDAKQELKEVIHEFFERAKKNLKKFEIVNIEEEKKIHTPSIIKKLSSFSTNCDKPIPQIIIERFHQEGLNIKIVNSILESYRKRKLELSLLDFDDLLYYWLGLLDFEEVKKHISRFKYIFIDELQDTNTIQFKIIEKIKEANPTVNLIAVGDEDQSIYGFRGANYKNVRKFKEKFNRCIVHTLTYNYRSTQSILSLANLSIANNTLRLGKKLLEQDPKKTKKGQRPVYISSIDDFKQGENITKQVISFLTSGYDYDQIVILVRNSNCFGRIEYSLNRAKIPYELRGGISLFQKAHIKLMLAILQIIINSKNVAAWRRVSQIIEGIGVKGITKLHKSLINERNPLKILINLPKLLRYRKILKLDPNGIKNLSQLFLRLIKIFDPDDKKKLLAKSLSQLIEEPIIKEGFRNIYGAKKNFDKRVEDLRHLSTYAENLTNPQLNEYITRLTLDQKDYGLNTEKNNNCVVISTIHQAKGLEWEVVFVASLVDEIFPDFRSKSLEEQEEERRLFYVAVTRAKERLYLTSYQKKKKDKYELDVELSQFIKELNPNIYRRE